METTYRQHSVSCAAPACTNLPGLPSRQFWEEGCRAGAEPILVPEEQRAQMCHAALQRRSLGRLCRFHRGSCSFTPSWTPVGSTSRGPQHCWQEHRFQNKAELSSNSDLAFHRLYNLGHISDPVQASVSLPVKKHLQQTHVTPAGLQVQQSKSVNRVAHSRYNQHQTPCQNQLPSPEGSGPLLVFD